MLNFFKRQPIQRASFTNTIEAFQYFVDILNRQTEGLQKITKNIAANSHKKAHCNDLKDIVQAELSKDWPSLKSKIIDAIEDREKAIKDFLKHM